MTQHRRAHPPAATVAGLAFALAAAFVITATVAAERGMVALWRITPCSSTRPRS